MQMLSLVSTHLVLRMWQRCFQVPQCQSLYSRLWGSEKAEATQAAMVALPQHTSSELNLSQQTNTVIQPLLAFWRRKQFPRWKERLQLSQAMLVLLRQWDRLVERNGVLYRKVFHPDGAEAMFQLLLPNALIGEVLTQVNQEHGHQGVEQTLALLRSRCYWPGMSSDVAQWCPNCERCQVAKDAHPKAHGFLGHLLASHPNKMLAIDYTTLEPTQNGVENVLVLTDIFSKYPSLLGTSVLPLWPGF